MSEWVVRKVGKRVIVVDDEEMHVVCTVHVNELDKEYREAAANIVSAAPELFNALCDLLKGASDENVEQAQAAIAKAMPE